MLSQIVDIFSALCVVVGTCFMLIASIGILRMPDFYIRMSTITKATSLGLGFILLGAAIHLNTLEIILKAAAILLFIVITSPVSAYIIAKAAKGIKVPFWEKTDLGDYLEAEETPDRPRKKNQ
jgi:multicomponent Na+:H+ antiporter subunit G